MKPLTLHNSLSRKEEVFEPLQNGKVGMYSCGPTVYNFAHIGNYRAYIADDLIARVFRYNGYDVTHVMNITDVDDKTIRDSRQVGESLAHFTGKYTAAFLEDLESLNISSITYHPKATDHISEMITLIEQLLITGNAYKGEDGCVYYSISSFPSYGKLSHIEKSQLQADASGRVRNDEYTKDNVQDFALWKAWTEEDGDVWWDSPFGRGRPGWHIECSAMSMKYLGVSFDIHAGGVDLLFPHHENEIAQSEAATHASFVRYWLHNEWLLVDGKKMAKSHGNFYTLRDILAKEYDPLAYRFFCLQTHYRQSLNFTFEALSAAQRGLKGLKVLVNLVKDRSTRQTAVQNNSEFAKNLQEGQEAFHESINVDFNSPKALAVLFSTLNQARSLENFLSQHDFMQLYEFILRCDDVLGLHLQESIPNTIPPHIIKLSEQRQRAREDKDWATADGFREKIESEGYTVEDTSDGSRIVML